MSKTRHRGIMASWHQVTEARRHGGAKASGHDVSPQGLTLRRGAATRVSEARGHGGTEVRSGAASLRRGFSLIEVLLSVFILSIGVISITALFPAGILQQRQSVDDITGPIVAQNALAILRTKLQPADFGTFVDVNNLPDFDPLFPTIQGDWGWRRPAFFKIDSMVNGVAVPAGSIIIFNDGSLSDLTNGVIPWNLSLYGNTAPKIVFMQSERYYPMASIETGIRPPKPQYVWDCMFRRFQGKVMVAIFVYRTTIAGGGDVAYSVPPQPPPNDDVPPMPIWLDITTSEMWADEGPWDADGDQFIWGTRAGEPYDSADQRQSWQEAGQWILDQNNNLHRVLSQTRDSAGDPVIAELVRPVPTMPVLPVYFLLDAGPQTGVEDVVSDIFYIPREVTLDGVQVRLTPVYVTVREL